MEDYIETKRLEFNVEYRIAMKESYYSIDLLLAFQKYFIFCKDSNETFKSVY